MLIVLPCKLWCNLIAEEEPSHPTRGVCPWGVPVTVLTDVPGHATHVTRQPFEHFVSPEGACLQNRGLRTAPYPSMHPWSLRPHPDQYCNAHVVWREEVAKIIN